MSAWNIKEVVPFVDKTSNINIKKKGVPVGDYLMISYPQQNTQRFQIFNKISGKPIFPTIFVNDSDVKEVADWLNKTYGEYFPIWEEYPDADIFGLARWGVKNGVKLFEILQQLKSKKVFERR